MSGASDRANRLSGDELRKISFGRTQAGRHPKSKLPFTIARDGEGRFSATGLLTGTGQSRVIGHRLCNYWDRFKTETCQVIYRNPDGAKTSGNDYILVQRSANLPFTLKD